MEKQIILEPFLTALKKERKRKKWSQRELSQKAGIPQSHLSRIEGGGYRSPAL